jgi:transposase
VDRAHNPGSRIAHRGSWRAGCAETRTSGSGGGPGKRTHRKAGHRAPGRPHLAGDALDECRRRVQQTTCGRRGRTGDPLYRARRTLHTGADLLTDKQAARLTALFAIDEHVEVEATWGIYQRMIAAYRHPDPAAGRELMVKLIESLSAGVPRPLVEIAKLGRTLSKRAADVLAYFDRPGTSNGPTEAINGRLEHLRGSALGFRNLTNYIARSLLETGGFRPRLHPAL